jgi:Ca2+-binding EF-hand superfamily protein
MPTYAPRWSSSRWELSSRYKQGVMVNMKSSGTIYTFNIIYLIQALVTGLVLLKVANTIADFVAFNLLPGGQSHVLANKRAEAVSKKSEFAEMGLKAALAAFQFGFFDRDHNGTVEAIDICRAFANIEGPDGEPTVKPEQAHAIATAIMEDADTDNGTAGALDFSEFMTCIDGDSIAFKDFLTKLQTRADLEDYEDCLASYQTQRKVVQQEKTKVVKRKSFSERHPSLASSMTHNSAVKQASSMGRSLFKSSNASEAAVDGDVNHI